jgi:hypothetical protein
MAKRSPWTGGKRRARSAPGSAARDGSPEWRIWTS